MPEDEKQKPAAPAAKPKPKPKEPEEPAADTHPLYKRLAELEPDALAEGSLIFKGDLTLKLKRERLAGTMQRLRDDEGFRCDYLACLTAVDYPDREKRFDMVYTLHSIPLGHRFSVVVEVGEDEEVASLAGLWKTADWQEREVYDMFGVRFAGHPDLRRILLPDWWEGHPLRKDYPVTGRGEHERVVEECLSPSDTE